MEDSYRGIVVSSEQMVRNGCRGGVSTSAWLMLRTGRYEGRCYFWLGGVVL
jgi:hypothetical protein